MQTLSTIATTVALAVHSLLGCCWHHDCAMVASGPPAAAACEAEHDCGDCRHHGQPHLPASPCQGETCVYVQAAPQSPPTLDAAVTAWHLPPPSRLACDDVLAAALCDDYDGPPTPLRLHLLHQVLLI